MQIYMYINIYIHIFFIIFSLTVCCREKHSIKDGKWEVAPQSIIWLALLASPGIRLTYLWGPIMSLPKPCSSLGQEAPLLDQWQTLGWQNKHSCRAMVQAIWIEVMSETTGIQSNTLQIMNSKHLVNLFFWEHQLQFEQNQGTWFQRQVSKHSMCTVLGDSYLQ